MVIAEAVEAETVLLMMAIAAAATAVILVVLMDLQMRDLRKRVTLLEWSLKGHTATILPAGHHTHEPIPGDLPPNSNSVVQDGRKGMSSRISLRPSGHHTHTVIVTFPYHSRRES